MLGPLSPKYRKIVLTLAGYLRVADLDVNILAAAQYLNHLAGPSLDSLYLTLLGTHVQRRGNIVELLLLQGAVLALELIPALTHTLSRNIAVSRTVVGAVHPIVVHAALAQRAPGAHALFGVSLDYNLHHANCVFQLVARQEVSALVLADESQVALAAVLANDVAGAERGPSHLGGLEDSV